MHIICSAPYSSFHAGQISLQYRTHRVKQTDMIIHVLRHLCFHAKTTIHVKTESEATSRSKLSLSKHSM